MNYWLVHCPSHHFECLKYLQENGNRTNWWNIHKNNMPGGEKEIRKHDIVFIWKAKGNTKGEERLKRLYGKAEVIDVPGRDREDSYWHRYVKIPEKIDEWLQQPSIDVRNIKLVLKNPLRESELIDKLMDVKFISSYHRWRTYKLNPKDGKIIEALLDER